MDYYAAGSGIFLQTFRDKLSIQSLGFKNPNLTCEFLKFTDLLYFVVPLWLAVTKLSIYSCGVRSGAVGCGTALKAESFGFYFLWGRTLDLGSTESPKEMSTRDTLWW